MKWRTKIGYTSGDLGISLIFFSVGFFFLFYLTDMVGLSPFLAGLAMSIGMIWDAVTDPLMGYICDNTRSRFGRRRVYLLFGSVPLGISFLLLWTIPDVGPTGLKFALATGFFLLFKTAYTVVAIPYMSLLPSLTTDYNERTQISGLRALTTQVGTILGGISALIVSSFLNLSIGLVGMGSLFGGITILLLLVTARSVKGIEEKKVEKKMSFREHLTPLKDRDFLVLIVMYFFGGIATTTLTASFLYFTKHVMGNASLGTFGLVVFVISSAIGIPIWLKASRIFEKKRVLLISTLMSAILLFITATTLHEGDVIPFFLLVALVGIYMSAYLILPYSLVPDIIDRAYSRTGRRQDSLFYGVWVFTHKIGLTLAPLIMGVVMGVLGYDGTLEEQAVSGLLAIRITFGVIPAIFLILTGSVVQLYSITRKQYDEIRREIEDRGFK